jgi:hypothetical protein
MSSDINPKDIAYQSPRRSSPVRENFDELRTQFNSLRSEVSALSTAASGSETVTARNSYPSLDERLRGQAGLLGNGVLTVKKMIDACDAVTAWTAGTGATALALDTANKVEGAASIKLGKSGTGSATIEYDLELTENFENKLIYLNLRIADAATLAKLSAVHFDITPDADFSTNYKRFTLTAALAAGWVQHSMTANSPTSTTGTVSDSASIINARLVIVTANASDTITAGLMNIDWVYCTGDELRVKATATPGMTVHVLAGQATLNGYGLYKSATATSGTITAPSANPRYDIVTLDIANTLLIFSGIEAASPAVPATPANHLKLADIYHRVGSTSIQDTDDSTNSYIIDRRALQSDQDIFYTPAQQRRKVFTSSGTWTRPAGVDLIHFTVVGGGGNGGDGLEASVDGDGAGGGGGGAGAVRIGTMPVVGDITVTVGAASEDSTITDGTTTITATAGSDGLDAYLTEAPETYGGNGGAGGGFGAGGGGGGAGGTVSGSAGDGGNWETAGTSGTPEYQEEQTSGGVGGSTIGHGGICAYTGGTAGIGLYGGGGGSAGYGSNGAAGGTTGTAGANASGYGAGGGGGGGNTASAAGGTGGPGLVIIEWFE